MINPRQSPGRTDPEAVAPNLTPLVDILFILLIFFILTAGAVFPALNLNLPEVVSEDISTADSRNILLEIHGGTYALDGKEIADFETLKSALPDAVRKNPGYERFVIAGDKGVSIEELLKVLSHLQSRSIEAVDILMKNEGVK